MAALGLLLALIGNAADQRLSGTSAEHLPLCIYASTPSAAREVLSTLLASMITMTSLVFSITMVVLTLAASQFGPRLIRNFMALPHTQIALGTFVMTAIYCLFSLGFTENTPSGELHAFPSISLAIALAALSIGVLVVFLHSLARAIMSESVIERVGIEVEEILSGFKEATPDATRTSEGEEVLPADFYEAACFFGPRCGGYVQALDSTALLRAASRSGTVIGLSFRPGDYVAEDGGGIGVYPGDRCDAGLRKRIQESIIVGPHRTPNQDPEFAIRHLVEIAVRALSPGINDPYTATAVIDQLSASLSRLMARTLPPPALRDQGGRIRVVSPVASYASLIGAAFNQIRQNGANKPIVVIHLIEAIIRISAHTRLDAQRHALKEHLDTIVAAALREIPDAFDHTAVEERADAARQALARRTGSACDSYGSRLPVYLLLTWSLATPVGGDQ